jgi:serpin B
MVVLLPKEKGGLTALEHSLNQKQLNDWLGQMRNQEVNVFLPKFKMTQEFGLARTLQDMGMTDAFSTGADFSGMDGTRNLFITAVVHKAFVEVDEEGTEAAAATGVMVGALAVRRPEPIPTFRADHPFLFLLRDTRSGSILFMGRLTDPTK